MPREERDVGVVELAVGSRRRSSLCVCLKTSVIQSKSRRAAEASTSSGCAGTRVCGPCGSWCRGEVQSSSAHGGSGGSLSGCRGSRWPCLVVVNGSPATITIETCEDPGDWTTAIGGTGSSEWAPWGRGGGGCAGWPLLDEMPVQSGELCPGLRLDLCARDPGPLAALCPCLWQEARRACSVGSSCSLSVPHRRHLLLLARAQGRGSAGRGHTGVPPGADGDHERPAAAGPGPPPTAPR